MTDWKKSEKDPVEAFHHYDVIGERIEVLVKMGEHKGIILELLEGSLFDRGSERSTFPRVFIPGAIGYDRFEEQGDLARAVSLIKEAANLVSAADPQAREAINDLAESLMSSLADEIREESS